MESDPFIQRRNVVFTQNSLEVRQNLQTVLTRLVLTSSLLFYFRISLFVLKVAGAITALMVDYDTPGKPIDLWVLVHISLDALELLAKLTKTLWISRTPQHAEYQDPLALAVVLGALSMFVFIWQVLGNIWYYSCSDCLDAAPVLAAYALFCLVLYYLQLCVGVVGLVSMVICLQLTMVVMGVLSGEEQEPASEQLISRLKRVNYSELKEEVENTCAICTEIYSDTNHIIVLECDAKHYFHERCITQWLRINANCPICRASIQRNE